MVERLLADSVVVLHAAFVAFVVAGGLLVLRWPRLAWVHVPAVLWGAAVELWGLVCPLTPLENALRQAAGEAGYAGSFVERYLLPLLYPAALSREVAVLLGLGAVAVNLLPYGWLLARRFRLGRARLGRRASRRG
jgi:hypothetical protein